MAKKGSPTWHALHHFPFFLPTSVCSLQHSRTMISTLMVTVIEVSIVFNTLR